MMIVCRLVKCTATMATKCTEKLEIDAAKENVINDERERKDYRIELTSFAESKSRFRRDELDV